MNKKRREEIDKIISQLDKISDSIKDIIYDEDESRRNMPENLEYSSAYEASENASDEMNNAVDLIDEAKDCLENAKGS